MTTFPRALVYPTSPLNRFDAHASMSYAFHPTVKDSDARPGSACALGILKAPCCGRNPGKPVNIAGEGRLALTLAMLCSNQPTPRSPTLVELNCSGSWDGLLKRKTCPTFHSLRRNPKGVLIGMLHFFSFFFFPFGNEWPLEISRAKFRYSLIP